MSLFNDSVIDRTLQSIGLVMASVVTGSRSHVKNAAATEGQEEKEDEY